MAFLLLDTPHVLQIKNWASHSETHPSGAKKYKGISQKKVMHFSDFHYEILLPRGGVMSKEVKLYLITSFPGAWKIGKFLEFYIWPGEKQTLLSILYLLTFKLVKHV